METVDRAQQTQGGGGDFFICYRQTIRRPARLRSSGSVRSGGASSPAMFATATAEPTSPKVSCIGQVRVKTGRRRRRKQQQKDIGGVETAAGAMRSRSTRETSFRRTDRSGRDRSWVHLPLGLVCDGLRSFGSEFNCCWNWKQIGFGSCFRCVSFSSCSCACGGRAGGSSSGGCWCGGGSCSGRRKSCDGAGCGGGSCCGGGCGSCAGNRCGGGSCSGRGCASCACNGCGGGSYSHGGCGSCAGNGCGGCSCSHGGCGSCAGNECCGGSCSVGGCGSCAGNECCGGSCFGGCGSCAGNECCRGSCFGGCGSCSGGGCGSWSGRCCGGRKRRKEVDVVVVEEMEVTEVRGLGGRRRGLELMGEVVAEGENIPVCIPPKNALLLMRCRSDPARVSTLKNRFQLEVEDAEDDAEEDDRRRRGRSGVQGVSAEVMEEDAVEAERDENVRFSQMGNVNGLVLDNVYTSEYDSEAGKLLKSPPPPPSQSKDAAKVIVEEKLQKKTQLEKVGEDKEEEKKKPSKKSALPITEPAQERRPSTTSREGHQNQLQRRSFSSEKEMVRRSTSYRESGRRSSFSSEGEARRSSFSIDKDSSKRRWSFSSEKESKLGPLLPPVPSGPAQANTGGGKSNKEKKELPDCLLLMMYEPKLSMEVSKETWVCSADFVRWQPHRRRQQQQQQQNNHSQGSAAAIKDDEATQGEDKKAVTEATTDSLTTTTPVIPSKPQQSHKAEAEVAAVTVPFALTRCKSEPTRLNSPHGEMSMPRLIGVAGIGF